MISNLPIIAHIPMNIWQVDYNSWCKTMTEGGHGKHIDDNNRLPFWAHLGENANFRNQPSGDDQEVQSENYSRRDILGLTMHEHTNNQSFEHLHIPTGNLAQAQNMQPTHAYFPNRNAVRLQERLQDDTRNQFYPQNMRLQNVQFENQNFVQAQEQRSQDRLYTRNTAYSRGLVLDQAAARYPPRNYTPVEQNTQFEHQSYLQAQEQRSDHRLYTRNSATSQSLALDRAAQRYLPHDYTPVEQDADGRPLPLGFAPDYWTCICGRGKAATDHSKFFSFYSAE